MDIYFVVIFLSLSILVKKEEDITGLDIKEENMRDGYVRERQSDVITEGERREATQERETDREEHSSSDNSREVRTEESTLSSDSTRPPSQTLLHLCSQAGPRSPPPPPPPPLPSVLDPLPPPPSAERDPPSSSKKTKFRPPPLKKTPDSVDK